MVSDLGRRLWLSLRATSSAVSCAPVLDLPSRRSLRPSSNAFSRAHTDISFPSAYFALLHAVPGQLNISTNRVKFAPTRGFRTLGLKRFTKRFGGGGEVSSDGDSVYSFGGGREEEEVGMMEVRPEDLVGVKKEKRLGFEGLQLSARDGKVCSFH